MEPHFALCFDDALAGGLRSSGVSVSVLGRVRLRHPWTVLSARRQLAELLRRERFDIVICHSSWPHLVFAPVVRAAGIALVYWRHDASDGSHWTDRWAARTVPDLVICNSRFTAGTFERVYSGVPRLILYYPVGHPRTCSDTELIDVRDRLSTPTRAVVIVQPSRMEEWKGHRLHLSALSLLADVPDWVCWIAGAPQRPAEEHYYQLLKDDALRYGIADRVRFAGWVEDVPKLLAAAQIHCQPNTGPEPFGLTFVEGMSAGLPIVTTALGAPLEIVTREVGMLVPPDDPPLLAKALRTLIEDANLRARIGSAGRVRARELCDPAARLNQLAGALTGSCGRSVW
jgi:glycosyltransferase involved in cell wall biosynthesis